MTEFKCIEGCAFCCSPVPMEETMLRKNQGKQVRSATKVVRTSPTELMVYTKDMKCIFLKEDNKCNIYEDRPKVCRTFGLNEKQACPYKTPNGNIRSEGKRKRIERQFNHRIKKMAKNKMVVEKLEKVD